MSETASTMLPLGTRAPGFTLPDSAGKLVSLDDFKDVGALLVVFVCNHCPYVKHIQKEFVSLAKQYQARGVGVVAISSNDVGNYPQDGPEKMAEESRQAGYTFPYLYDETRKWPRPTRLLAPRIYFSLIRTTASCTGDSLMTAGPGTRVR